MKKYILRKEFFGGIIYDKKYKNNVAIDKETYNLIKILNKNNEAYEENIKKLKKLNKNEIFEILHNLAEIEILELNLEEKEQSSVPKNYLSAPFRIFYDITYKCNLRCKHCFTDSGEENEKELSLDEKIDLVYQAKQLGVQKISIAGGEPFTSEDIYAFIKECNNNDIDVSITTNGILINKNVIEKINNLNISNLTISFDGGNAESMDQIRGKGIFLKVIESLKLLNKEYNGRYSLKTTLMKNNINEIEDIINIGIKYGCDMVKFNAVREDGRALNNKNNIIINQNEYIKAIKTIEKLRGKYKDKIKIRAPLNIYCTEEYEYIEELGFGCFAGKESICIDPIGNIKPCTHYSEEYICGNIREDNLIDIWKNSKILKIFRELEGNEKCNNCDQYNKCRGGCRYRCFLNKDINGIDPFCYLYKNK